MPVKIARYSRHLVHSACTWSDALLVDTAESTIAHSDNAPNRSLWQNIANKDIYGELITAAT